MGCDTQGRLLGKVSVSEVLNFIRQRYDMTATEHITTTNYNFEPPEGSIYYDRRFHYNNSGFINFKTENGYRNLFYSYCSVNYLENLDYYKERDLEDMVKSETTFISLGYNEEAVEIITEIVKHFGGWVDDNDCDSEPYYKVEQVKDESIKPVMKVTMQDIFEKFGATVEIEGKSL